MPWPATGIHLEEEFRVKTGKVVKTCYQGLKLGREEERVASLKMENILTHAIKIKFAPKKKDHGFQQMMMMKKNNISCIACLAQSRIWDIGDLNSKSPHFDWTSAPNMAGPKMRTAGHKQ